MAAQLKDDGRFPAVQILRKNEFSRFIAACENPKQASDKLKNSVRSGK